MFRDESDMEVELDISSIRWTDESIEKVGVGWESVFDTVEPVVLLWKMIQIWAKYFG